MSNDKDSKAIKQAEKFPVREGQGNDSSILSDKDRAAGEESGNSGSYPQPDVADKNLKNQDEYSYTDKDKENKSA